MSRFFTIIGNDVRIIFKDIKALIPILVMPLVIIIVFSVALSPLLENTSFVEPFTVVLVDEDKSSWTALLGTQLKNLEIVGKVIYTDEEEARRLIENHEAAAAIILPKDLVHSIDYLDPKDGRVIGSTLMYLQSQIVKNIGIVGSNAISAGLASINVIYEMESENGYSQEALFDEINKSNQEFINLVLNRKAVISEKKYQKPDVEPYIYYSLSLLSVFILFSSIPCMKLLTEERRLGILSRINAGPIPSWYTIASKLLVSFMVSSVQFIIILAFMIILGGRHLISVIGPMVPIFMATTLAAGSFSIFIASISGTGNATDLIANLSILLMAVIGGSIYPITSLPPVCRVLNIFTINRWATEGFLNALFDQDSSGAVQSITALVLLSLLFMALAALILRIKRRRVSG